MECGCQRGCRTWTRPSPLRRAGLILTACCICRRIALRLHTHIRGIVPSLHIIVRGTPSTFLETLGDMGQYGLTAMAPMAYRIGCVPFMRYLRTLYGCLTVWASTQRQQFGNGTQRYAFLRPCLLENEIADIGRLYAAFPAGEGIVILSCGRTMVRPYIAGTRACALRRER